MLLLEYRQDECVEVPIIRPTLPEVRHEEDYAHFLATRCCTQAQIVLEVELAHIAIVSGNPRNYVLALYVSIEPSINKNFFFKCT